MSVCLVQNASANCSIASLAGSVPLAIRHSSSVMVPSIVPQAVLRDTLPNPAEPMIADTTGVAAPAFTVMHWINAPNRDSTVRFGDGHVYVLDFTATWCEGCPAIYPPLMTIDHQYASQGVRVILVTGMEEFTVDYIQKYYQHEHDHITLPIAVAGLGNPLVFEQYGVASLPTIVVIDQHGIVRYRWHGAEDLKNASTVLRALLRKSP